MDIHFRSLPPFDAEYYRRRWTIRFCILGLTMLLLVSAAILSLNILQGHQRSSKVKIWISITPFFVHSLQLLSAIVMLHSRRKDLKFLEWCQWWLRTSKRLLPAISIEVSVLWMLEFNILMIFLTTAPYLVGIIKMNQIMKTTGLSSGVLRVTPHQITLCSGIGNMRLPRHIEINSPEPPPANNPEMQVYNELRRKDDYLPSYREAEEMILQFQKTDQPPRYADVVVSEHG